MKWFRSFLKWFNEDLSMKRRITIINVLLVTFIITIVGSVMYTQLGKKLQENEARFIHQNLESTELVLANYLESFLRKSDVIFSNTILQEALARDYSEANMADVVKVYKNELYRTINPVMDEVFLQDFYVEETGRVKSVHLPKAKIYVDNPNLPVDGGLIHEVAAIDHDEFVRLTKEAGGAVVWRGRFEDKGVDYVSVNRQLKSFDTLEEIGLLSIQIPVSQVEYILTENNDGYNMKVYLIDEDDQIIENKNDAIFFEEEYVIKLYSSVAPEYGHTIEYEGVRYLVDTITMKGTGWQLMAVYPYDVVTETLKPYQLLISIILLLGLFMAILFSILISNAVTKRIDLITLKMGQLSIDRHADVAPIGGNDEIGELDRIFHRMLLQISQLVESEVTHELEHSKLEVELLQSQINPHILYNTLAVLSYKAKKIGEHEINEVTDKLIRFFKYYLNSGSLMSHVSAEMEMIHHYVDIIQYTYNMEVDYVMDVDESINHLPILNLILQPIVENALIHGLRPSQEKKVLTIYGRKVQECLYFEINDNGIGMDEERLTLLRQGDETVSRAGYGLSNVTKRIQLYFGGNYKLNIVSTQGVGTKVSLELPVLDSY